jgi:predicted nuclease of predicted toxin-antitoxin system
LGDKGHEAVAARDIGLRDADDHEICARAQTDRAIIVTKDEDFAQMVAANDERPSVLWVRTGNVLNRVLLSRFESAWAQIEEHLKSGTRLVEIR